MADTNNTPTDTPHFETDEVDANLAIEQGLGVGARELAAQRDPGGGVNLDEKDDDGETDGNRSSADDVEQSGA